MSSIYCHKAGCGRTCRGERDTQGRPLCDQHAKKDQEEEVEYSECRVTFTLPQWVAEDRFEYRKVHHFPKGHAYAGSYDRETLHNRVDDALFTLGYDELCLHPMGQWVSFKLDGPPARLPGQIAEAERRLRACLAKWKDDQPEKEEEV